MVLRQTKVRTYKSKGCRTTLGTGCKYGSAVGEQGRVHNSARQGGVDELGQRWAGFQVRVGPLALIISFRVKKFQSIFWGGGGAW